MTKKTHPPFIGRAGWRTTDYAALDSVPGRSPCERPKQDSALRCAERKVSAIAVGIGTGSTCAGFRLVPHTMAFFRRV